MKATTSGLRDNRALVFMGFVPFFTVYFVKNDTLITVPTASVRIRFKISYTCLIC